MSQVVGVDEAGRGPIAGPVSVGVICAPENFDFLGTFPGLNDSKKLTERRREALFTLLEEEVQKGTLTYHVELMDQEVIDTKGISYAVRHGIERGIRTLMPEPQGKVWLDGLLKAPEEYEQETVVGGDALIPAIMLASVAAKVVRDRHMTQLAATYPAYGFERHKGYGTRAHYEALRLHGPCDLHRRTYIHSVELDAVT